MLALRADVRVEADIARAVTRVVTEWGGLDILVNNAGVGGFVEVSDMTSADWHRVVDTNLTGVYHSCHAALPHLKARGGGSIINVSSLAGSDALRGRRRLLRVEGRAECIQRVADAGSAASTAFV